MTRNETILQHCLRITQSFVAHKCDSNCKFHDVVKSHSCSKQCRALCYIAEARIKLLGPESAYPAHSLEAIRKHCDTASESHRCSRVCLFHFAVKKHRCKKRKRRICPAQCSIRKQQLRSKPPHKAAKKLREGEEDNEDYGYIDQLDEYDEFEDMGPGFHGGHSY